MLFPLVALLISLVSLAVTAQDASALSTADQLAGMTVKESFNGSSASLASFSVNWSALGWASGTSAKGEDTTTGWRPVAAYSTVNGAFYTPTVTDAGGGIAAVATMAANPSLESRHFSLWLDMPSPSTTRAGYELRFTDTVSGVYEVTLFKWQAGVQTILTSRSKYGFANGNSFALLDQGSAVSVWTDTGSGFTQLLSATDGSFSGGNAGVQGAGNITRLTNFKVGPLGTQTLDANAPDTTISSGPAGIIYASTASFSFTADEAGSTFECLLDGAAYSACASPKTYASVPQGPHTFRVRAVDAAGNKDETPAERSFQVAQPPAATTKAPRAVKAHEATLDAGINPNGSDTTYQFEYGATTAYGRVIPAAPKEIPSGNDSVEVSEWIGGLESGTTYHFRIVATNAAGTTRSEDRTFITPTAPAATTQAATVVRATESTLNASVNPKGAATSYQFEYGRTISYGSKIPVTAKAAGSGTSPVAVSETPSGLAEATTYHYRVVAENEVGTAYGTDEMLTTPVLPAATTESATAVDANEAILNGTIDPNGFDTTYQFEYGTTTSYGSIAPASAEPVGSGTDISEAEEAVAFLDPATTYHYRVVATSEAGTVRGEDRTLTTAAATVSRQQEEEERQEERAFTAKFTGPLPGDFVNMMWSGNNPPTAEPSNMEVIRRSGAKMLRLGVEQGQLFDEIFERAATRGITILPGLGGGHPPKRSEWGAWKQHVEGVVNRYGHGGSFWSTMDPSQRRPPEYWEVWNEPNVARNAPDGQVNPAEFGELLEETARAVKAADSNAKIILGGLLSVSESPGTEDHRTVSEFLHQMGNHGRNSYDALSLHPYAFKA
ncbi:MAG: hypothetical protein WBM00_03745, partial [Solirubrobacterales bacterium]